MMSGAQKRFRQQAGVVTEISASVWYPNGGPAVVMIVGLTVVLTNDSRGNRTL